MGWNGVFNFVDNVVYNWVHRSSDGGDYTAMFNLINNCCKPGPATPKGENAGHRILKPEGLMKLFSVTEKHLHWKKRTGSGRNSGQPAYPSRNPGGGKAQATDAQASASGGPACK